MQKTSWPNRRVKQQHRRFIKGKNKTWCLVYGLKVVGDNQFHYVGQTRVTLQGRLHAHFHAIGKAEAIGRTLSPVQRWLKAMLETGDHRVKIETIDENGVWDISEVVWIDRLSNAGHPLKNVAGRVLGNEKLNEAMLASPLTLSWKS